MTRDVPHTDENIKFYEIHPSKDIKSKLGTELLNKKIVVCVTASVACYKSIDLIRILMRHGAEVYVVMSKTVEEFISRDYFVWASGNDVVTKLSGNLEHVSLADYDKSDLVIVYPCTANTIGKFANGIDDTPVTSVLSVALGSKIPIIIAPAMHESMYENDIIKENIEKLKNKNVIFISPQIEEGKAKVASVENVLRVAINVIHKNNNNNNSYINNNGLENKHKEESFIKYPLDHISQITQKELYKFFKNKKVLISLGSTVEYIDPIRVISNTSSGKMGFSLVKNAMEFGLNVTIVKGLTSHSVNLDENGKGSITKSIDVKTTQQMFDEIKREMSIQTYDIIILAAAVSDFRPLTYSDHKIGSKESTLKLTLVPTIKIVDTIKNTYISTFLVAFKAEYCIEEVDLLQKSYTKLTDANADLVVANDIGKKDVFIGSDFNQVLIVDKNKGYYQFPTQNKDDVAMDIFRIIYLNMKKV